MHLTTSEEWNLSCISSDEMLMSNTDPHHTCNIIFDRFCRSEQKLSFTTRIRSNATESTTSHPPTSSFTNQRLYIYILYSMGKNNRAKSRSNGGKKTNEVSTRVTKHKRAGTNTWHVLRLQKDCLHDIRACMARDQNKKGNEKIHWTRMCPLANANIEKRCFVTGQKVGDVAAVFLAGVMEYMVMEVLELSGNRVKDERRSRITPTDINVITECVFFFTKHRVFPRTTSQRRRGVPKVVPKRCHCKERPHSKIQRKHSESHLQIMEEEEALKVQMRRKPDDTLRRCECTHQINSQWIL